MLPSDWHFLSSLEGTCNPVFFFGECVLTEGTPCFLSFRYIFLPLPTGVREKRKKDHLKPFLLLPFETLQLLTAWPRYTKLCKLSFSNFMVFTHFPIIPTFSPNFHFYSYDTQSDQLGWLRRENRTPRNEVKLKGVSGDVNKFLSPLLRLRSLPNKGRI